MDIDVLSNLVIEKVLCASTIFNQEGAKAKRNNRSSWAAAIKYEGETVYSARGKDFISNLNSLVILPKGSAYEWQCLQSGHCTLIEFESKMTYDGIFRFPVQNGEKMLKMFKDVEYKKTAGRPMLEIEMIRDVYSIILALVNSAPKKYLPTDRQRKIAPALEYISQNCNRNITNDELAKVTGLSNVYFRKLFVDIMGVSPIAYVHEKRIGKAKELLRSDYGTISDIAQSLGYANLCDFSRDFKKHTGVSPSKY